MHINPIDASNKLKKVKRTSTAEFPYETASIRETDDKVSISSDAKAIEKAMSIAKNSEVERQDVIETIKANISSGTYVIDSAKLAEKIIKRG
jgi:flagellar biosynthesis anti-sigma factor FlgM